MTCSPGMRARWLHHSFTRSAELHGEPNTGQGVAQITPSSRFQWLPKARHQTPPPRRCQPPSTGQGSTEPHPAQPSQGRASGAGVARHLVLSSGLKASSKPAQRHTKEVTRRALKRRRSIALHGMKGMHGIKGPDGMHGTNGVIEGDWNG